MTNKTQIPKSKVSFSLCSRLPRNYDLLAIRYLPFAISAIGGQAPFANVFLKMVYHRDSQSLSVTLRVPVLH